MSKFPRWGLSVLTMASVATLVLLVTGWGSAIASSVQSVIVANPVSNPANVHETGTANVNVTNTTAMPVNAKNLNTDTNGNLKVAETNTDANGNLAVHEQGTASVKVTNTASSPLPVAGQVGISGTPSVNVANFPTAPDAAATKVIGSGHTTIGTGGSKVLIPVNWDPTQIPPPLT